MSRLLLFFAQLVVCTSLVPLGVLLAQQPLDAESSRENIAAPDQAESTNPGTNAQETGTQETGTTKSAPSSTPSQFISPAGPDVFFLPDETGRLRMVLGFSYEKFLQLWKNQREESAPKPPGVVLSNLEVTGDVETNLARLKIKIELEVREAGWNKVPLYMPKLVLQHSMIRGKSDGECIIYDPQQDSYFAWLRSRANQRRYLELEGLLRLASESNETSLELYVPRSTNSTMKLDFNQQELQFQASLGLKIESIAQTDQGTQVYVTGQARPLRLRWSEPQREIVPVNPLVKSTGRQTVRISPRSIQHQIDLDIESNQAPLKEIRVRLPKGTTLLPNRSSKDYFAQVESNQENGDYQVVLLRSLHAASRSWQVTLFAETTTDGRSTEATHAIDGFEVLNAYQQSGTLLLQVDTPLQAYFDLEGNLEQSPLSESPPSSSDTKSIGFFQYSHNPWKLLVHVLPQKRRVSVRPNYELTVGSQEARLELDFNYQFTGARTYFVRIDLHGWQLTDDPIDSGGAVDDQLYTITRKGLVNFPLVNPETGRLRLRFVTKKNLRTGLHRLPLPEPLGVFVADGQLRVNHDTSLELIPRMDASEGLNLITPGDEFSSPQDSGTQDRDSIDNQPLPMNFRAYRSDPILELEVLHREREIEVAIDTQVTLGPESAEVQQLFEYEVRHRPTSQLTFQVHNDLWKNESFSISLGDEELEFGLEVAGQDETAQKELESESDASDSRHIFVALPRPLEGNFMLKAFYRSPVVEVAPTTSTPFFLPLASPQDSLQRHVTTVRCTGPLEAVVHQGSPGEDWALLRESDDGSDLARDLRLLATQATQEIPLLLQLKQDDQAKLASIERVWIQSWLLENKQQTRAIYLFRSEHASASILLPQEVRIPSVEVLLDKQPVPFFLTGENRLRVDLPDSPQVVSHTLELRYFQPLDLPEWGTLSTSLPVFEGQASISPAYWQVILPSQWVVGFAPSHLIGDYWLGWKGSQWGRQPSLSQEDLEKLLDASSLPSPPQTMRRYLYQTFQLPTTIQLTLFRSYWLTLGSATLVFCVGLICLYTSVLRNKLSWLLLVLFLFALTSSFPEVILTIIQALLLGAIMTAITYVLKRILDPNTMRETNVPIDAASHSTAVTESWSLMEHDSALQQQETTASVPLSGDSE